jgi:hypothetical protein
MLFIILKNKNKQIRNKINEQLGKTVTITDKHKNNNKNIIIITRIAYNVVSQLSKWSILQILCVMSAFLDISNDRLYETNDLSLILNRIYILFLLASIFIVISFGLNNIYNLYLDD